jgi:hypothetical protein
MWGFSTPWYLLVLVALSIWASGMYGIWVHTSRVSQLQRKGWRLGKWRAIADLGQKLNGQSDLELKKYLEEAAPQIMYNIRYDQASEIKHVSLIPLRTRSFNEGRRRLGTPGGTSLERLDPMLAQRDGEKASRPISNTV